MPGTEVGAGNKTKISTLAFLHENFLY